MGFMNGNNIFFPDTQMKSKWKKQNYILVGYPPDAKNQLISTYLECKEHFYKLIHTSLQSVYSGFYVKSNIVKHKFSGVKLRPFEERDTCWWKQEHL